MSGSILANAEQQLEAQAIIYNHMFRFVASMTLKCAVELGIPEAVDSHGIPISLPDLLTSLRLPHNKSSHLYRLMRFLTRSGFFTVNDGAYSITPLSRLLLTNVGNKSMAPFVLAMLDPVFVEPFHAMSSWLRSNEPTAFAMEHGCSFWEYNRRDKAFDKIFNEAMACDSGMVMDAFVKGCGESVLQGVGSLVDVGGGSGTAARAITAAFPHVKCTVLDQPNVVEEELVRAVAPTVDFIAGDMFQYVPPADAILLKWILHNWSDEDCVKILKKCKTAITFNGKERGKVIIIDLVLNHEYSYDMIMMVNFGGMEREEGDWKKIFDESCFTSYKIFALGLVSVIELYP